MLPRRYLIQPGPLQLSCHERNAGAPDAEHLRQELLRQIEIFRLGEVVHSQKPTAHSCFHGVAGVAGGGLLGLCQHHLLVAHQGGSQRWKFIGERTQGIDADG
jgi:hypothetical protein